MRQNYKIIGVAYIVFCFKFVFHKLVKPIHIHIHQQLRGEVAEWQTNTQTRGIKTPHDF